MNFTTLVKGGAGASLRWMRRRPRLTVYLLLLLITAVVAFHYRTAPAQVVPTVRRGTGTNVAACVALVAVAQFTLVTRFPGLSPLADVLGSPRLGLDVVENMGLTLRGKRVDEMWPWLLRLPDGRVLLSAVFVGIPVPDRDRGAERVYDHFAVDAVRHDSAGKVLTVPWYLPVGRKRRKSLRTITFHPSALPDAVDEPNHFAPEAHR